MGRRDQSSLGNTSRPPSSALPSFPSRSHSIQRSVAGPQPTEIELSASSVCRGQALRAYRQAQKPDRRKTTEPFTIAA